MDEISFFYIRIMEGLATGPLLSSSPIVTTIVAGTNVTIAPTDGIGSVTINSSGGGGGGEVFQATYYKSVAQNLTSGNTDITFDEEGSWNNDNGYITHTAGSTDFTIVQAGLYQLEFNTTILAGGATWLSTSNKGISIDITRSPTAEQVTIGQSAFIASGTNYLQSVCSTYDLVAGDVINCRISNTFTGGPAQAQCVQNTFDLNTWFTWRYVASGGATPAGGVVSIAGVDGAVTLSSPGGTIGITANGQDIELTNTGVVSVTGGSGISVDLAGGDATINNTGVLSISDGTNEPSTGAIVLSGSDGVSVIDTAGTFAITNTGVTELTGGDGIGLDVQTGSVTISNLGLLSASADPGIGVSTTSGVLTISNKGVRTLADLSGAIVLSPGTGIGLVTTIETNTLTLSNTGLTSASAGAGIFISTSSGVATISNTGVRTLNDLSGAVLLSAGSGIQLNNNSGAGPLTIDNTGAVSVNAQTGAILIEAVGAGISVTNTETPSIGISNTGVLSTIAGTGISVSGATGNVTIATTTPVFNYSQVTTSTIINSTNFVSVDLLSISTIRPAAPIGAWGTALFTDLGSASGSQVDLYLSINGVAGPTQRVDIVKDHSQSFALMGSGTGPSPGGGVSISLNASTIVGDTQVTFANAMAFSDMYQTL
jgi:hypothetical protein